MKADQGRPYTKPTNPPDKTFTDTKWLYEIFIYDSRVEIFQSLRDNIQQRLVIQKNDLANFETLLQNNGFKQV